MQYSLENETENECDEDDYVPQAANGCAVLRVMTTYCKCKAILHVVTCMFMHPFFCISFLWCNITMILVALQITTYPKFEL